MQKIFFIVVIFMCILGYKSELKADLNLSKNTITKSKSYTGCDEAIIMDYVSVVKDCRDNAKPNSLDYYKYEAFVSDKESELPSASHFYELYLEKENNIKNKVQFHVLYGDALLRNFKYFEGMRQYSKALLYGNHPDIKDSQFLKLQKAHIDSGKTDILFLLSFYETSIQDYIAIESEIINIDDPQAHKTLLNIYYKLIDIYVEIKNFDKAKIYVEKLEKLTQKSSAISYDAYYQQAYLYYTLNRQYYEPSELDLENLLYRINEINQIKEVSVMDSDFIFRFHIVEALFNGYASNFDYAERVLSDIEYKERQEAHWAILYRKKQVFQALHMVKKIQGNIALSLNSKFKEITAMEDMVGEQDKDVVLKLKKQIFDMQQNLKKEENQLVELEKSGLIEKLTNDVNLFNVSSLGFIILFLIQFSFVVYFVGKRFIQHQLRKTKYLYTRNVNWKTNYLVVRESQPKEAFSLIGIDFGYFDEYLNKLNDNQKSNVQWVFEHLIKNNLRKGDMMIRYPQDKIFIIARGTPEEVHFLCERLKFILESNLHLNGYLYFGIHEITDGQTQAAPFVIEKINNGIQNRVFINK